MATDLGEAVELFIMHVIRGVRDVHDAEPIVLALTCDDLTYLQVCCASPRESNLVTFQAVVEAYTQEYCPRLPYYHKYMSAASQREYSDLRAGIDAVLKNRRLLSVFGPKNVQTF